MSLIFSMSHSMSDFFLGCRTKILACRSDTLKPLVDQPGINRNHPCINQHYFTKAKICIMRESELVVQYLTQSQQYCKRWYNLFIRKLSLHMMHWLEWISADWMHKLNFGTVEAYEHSEWVLDCFQSSMSASIPTDPRNKPVCHLFYKMGVKKSKKGSSKYEVTGHMAIHTSDVHAQGKFTDAGKIY